MIKPGAKIRNARAPNVIGTFGCIVRSKSEIPIDYILTASHVIGLNGYGLPGDAIEAQSSDQTWVKIGEFERATALKDISGTQQICDAAIARITNSAMVDAEIQQIGRPGPISTGIFRGQTLKFFGAGSGLRDGLSLQSSGVDVDVSYFTLSGESTFTLSFRDQILYGFANGANLQPATGPMDSGALVVTSRNLAVGLHIARTPDEYPIAASVCTPLEVVLNVLNVDLPINSDHDLYSVTPDRISTRAFDELGVILRSQMEPHNDFGGVRWKLVEGGVVIDGVLERTPGALVTVPRVWENFCKEICDAAQEYSVPVELIIATICNESSGNRRAVRLESGYISDEETPRRVSAGLMQTLLSTARGELKEAVNREDLFDPINSIRAGTSYIARQKTITSFDPPLVACAYNAGHLEHNSGVANRWKILQYPYNTGAHADRFVKWFNDSCAFFEENPGFIPESAPSFHLLFKGA